MSQNLTSWGGVCTSPANTIPNRLTTTTNTQNMQSRIRMFLSKRVKVMWPVGSLEVEEVLSPSTVILTSLTVKLRFSDVVVLLILMYVAYAKALLRVKWPVVGAQR